MAKNLASGVANGRLTKLSSGTLTLTDTNNYLANTVSVTVLSVVPEPSTWALVGVGIADIGVTVLRHRFTAARA